MTHTWKVFDSVATADAINRNEILTVDITLTFYSIIWSIVAVVVVVAAVQWSTVEFKCLQLKHVSIDFTIFPLPEFPL